MRHAQSDRPPAEQPGLRQPPDTRFRWRRRQLLQAGAGSLLAGSGLTLAWNNRACAGSIGTPMDMAMEAGHTGGWSSADLPFDPQQILRSFEYGRLIEENGQPLRLFEVEARSITIPLAADVRFKAWSLEALRQQVRLASTAPATATKLSQAQQAIEAASTAIAPSLPSQPSLVLTVTRQLARAAASEYDAAVADGRIVETIEYQDARGFLLQADRLLSQAIQAAGSAAGDLQPAQARIRAMLQAFPTSRPPARTRLGVDRIRALAEGF